MTFHNCSQATVQSLKLVVDWIGRGRAMLNFVIRGPFISNTRSSYQPTSLHSTPDPLLYSERLFLSLSVEDSSEGYKPVLLYWSHSPDTLKTCYDRLTLQDVSPLQPFLLRLPIKQSKRVFKQFVWGDVIHWYGNTGKQKGFQSAAIQYRVEEYSFQSWQQRCILGIPLVAGFPWCSISCHRKVRCWRIFRPSVLRVVGRFQG